MNLRNRTVLITGGATGIGWALAKRFMGAENRVIVCGRRAERLEAASLALPEVITIQCDLAVEEFADHAWERLCAGCEEFGFGFSERNRLS